MESQLPDELLQGMERSGVIAVLVIDDPRDAVPVAGALLDGGVDCMELTLRTPAAINALRAVREGVPKMLAGVGTILNARQVEIVSQAGAAFGVSPGVHAGVIAAARRAGLPFAPGVITPTDVESAIELGCRELKFFPAEPSGGLAYLRSMAAPYLHLGLRFVPLGGVNAENMVDYLADPLILAVGGSWLAPRASIRDSDWAGIRTRAEAARRAVDELRRGEGR